MNKQAIEGAAKAIFKSGLMEGVSSEWEYLSEDEKAPYVLLAQSAVAGYLKSVSSDVIAGFKDQLNGERTYNGAVAVIAAQGVSVVESCIKSWMQFAELATERKLSQHQMQVIKSAQIACSIAVLRGVDHE